MKLKKVFLSTLLSAALMVSFMPTAALAGEAAGDSQAVGSVQAAGDVQVTGDIQAASDVHVAGSDAANVQAGGSASAKAPDSDDLLMQYIDQKVADELGSDADGSTLLRGAAHPRRDALANDPVAGNMYDVFAPAVKKVAAGDLEVTSFIAQGDEIFGNAKFNAAYLGVDKLMDDPQTINREAYNKFVQALQASLNSSLNNMLTAMVCDMPFELYWLDNEKGISYSFPPDWILNNIQYYPQEDCLGIETDSKLEMTFDFYVSQDYSLGGSPKEYGPAGTTKVNTELTKAAANTAKNISGILAKAKEESDVAKMMFYKDEICRMTAYHPTAMKDPDFPYGDPWQLINVFDGDEGTKVVCEGYSKAFQYLCDNTKFSDKSVESFIVSGKMTVADGEKTTTGEHMWNIVHMDDGYNYIVDVTNCDDDSLPPTTERYPNTVFLTAAIAGSVNDGYTYEYAEGKTLKFVYSDEILNIYSPIELTLASNSYPHDKGNAVFAPNTMKASGKTVKLKAAALKKKAQTIAAKKAFTVKAPRGPVSYKLVKVSKKSAAKMFTVAKAGKITVKKGLKKGTYKLTVAVNADGDGMYAKKTQNVNVTVKVTK